MTGKAGNKMHPDESKKSYIETNLSVASNCSLSFIDRVNTERLLKVQIYENSGELTLEPAEKFQPQ